MFSDYGMHESFAGKLGRLQEAFLDFHINEGGGLGGNWGERS